MSNALERWKKRSCSTVELPSGATVTVQLVNVAAQILAGAFPPHIIGLARAMESGTADLDHELTDEEIEAATGYRHVIVGLMIREVEGEPVELTIEDVAALPVQDVEMLWAYHLRLVPMKNEADPGPFGTSDSETSPSS